VNEILSCHFKKNDEVVVNWAYLDVKIVKNKESWDDVWINQD
jgi:hypothetical protein